MVKLKVKWKTPTAENVSYYEVLLKKGIFSKRSVIPSHTNSADGYSTLKIGLDHRYKQFRVRAISNEKYIGNWTDWIDIAKSAIKPVHNLYAQNMGTFVHVTWESEKVSYFEVSFSQNKNSFKPLTKIQKNRSGKYEFKHPIQTQAGYYKVIACKVIDKKKNIVMRSEECVTTIEKPNSPKILKLSQSSLPVSIYTEKLHENALENEFNKAIEDMTNQNLIEMSKISGSKIIKEKIKARQIKAYGNNLKGIDKARIDDSLSTKILLVKDNTNSIPTTNEETIKLFVPIGINPGKYNLILTNTSQGFENRESHVKLEIYSPEEKLPSEITERKIEESSEDEILLSWNIPQSGGHIDYFIVIREDLGSDYDNIKSKKIKKMKFTPANYPELLRKIAESRSDDGVSVSFLDKYDIITSHKYNYWVIGKNEAGEGPMQKAPISAWAFSETENKEVPHPNNFNAHFDKNSNFNMEGELKKEKEDNN